MQSKTVQPLPADAGATAFSAAIRPGRDALVVFVGLALSLTAIFLFTAWYAERSNAAGDPNQVVGKAQAVATCASIVVALGCAAFVYHSRSRTKLVLEAYDASMAQLRSAYQGAEHRAASKSSTLTTMSHELRTPLTAILGFTDLLLEPGCDVTMMRAHIQTIRRNGQHLLAVLNDILDLSRIEAGVLHVESAPCDALQVMRDVVDLFGSRAREKQIALEFRADGGIPGEVATDPMRLRQILMNVVGNAVKFTEVGGVLINVRHDSERKVIVFEVADTGIGIEQEALESLFTPFRQAERTTAKRYGGSGLGLAISKRLAHALGGDISVTSRLGHGSTFSVTIPAAPIPDAPSIRTGIPVHSGSDVVHEDRARGRRTEGGEGRSEPVPGVGKLNEVEAVASDRSKARSSPPGASPHA